MIIETSPFLRCLMTSAWIAKELGVNKVHVRYTLVEILSPQLADVHENPMPFLEFTKADFDFAKMKQ